MDRLRVINGKRRLRSRKWFFPIKICGQATGHSFEGIYLKTGQKKQTSWESKPIENGKNWSKFKVTRAQTCMIFPHLFNIGAEIKLMLNRIEVP